MNAAPTRSAAGFTLVELIIGMTLSLMVMGAILSSYIFLGRNFARQGMGSGNEPNLEAQGRRTLAYFTQDVRMASGILADPTLATGVQVMPTQSQVTFILSAPSGSKYVTYFFNSTDGDDDTSLWPFTIPSHSLARIDVAASTIQILHRNLLNPTPPSTLGFYFRYFDASGRAYDNATPPYTTTTDYLSGIKRVAVSFSSQGGDVNKNTLTPVYTNASPRLILRNRQLLP